MITELNENNFDSATKNGIKLIEFHTSWCGYCKTQQPELEAMDKVWIGQVDADKETMIASKFNVNAFPTFVILKNGEEVERFSGMHKKENLMSIIIKYLK